ncbi:MAG: hypothetical protein ACYSTZ_08730 [Planctomycetota bacterium]|jgi:hypothetical protein
MLKTPNRGQRSGKEDRMIENGDSEHPGARETASTVQPCCSAGSDSSCCPSGADSGGGKKWKTLVFILIVIAAGAVVARSFINKSNSNAGQSQQAFTPIQTNTACDITSPLSTLTTPQTPGKAEPAVDAPSRANDTTETQPPDEPESTLSFKPLDSLASLNTVAANFDAVFILLGGEDQLNMEPITKEVEAAAKKIRAGGVRVSAFTLKKDSPNRAQLAKQFSIPSVVAMVKGRGASGVSGEITEAKLIQAFVTASRSGSSCCPGGSGGTCAQRPAPARSK